ncbi:hypothetical protein [Alkalinema sp. FACHB-956]|uniref:hypothetical protein n=1 Tax=Alkalinema sp. FACHB-956 TaxID=2692768 RepID=UPI001689AA0A|nr:hypothetical protein [Alkalinema sp. FACHB-956]MBD2325761.1 hypothetical protein [Alkalinema sp. FACHB-956]
MISTEKPLRARQSLQSSPRSPFPPGKWGLVGILVLLWKGWSYWLLNRMQHSGESLPVSALYRGGDMEYYPLINAVGQLQWGEFALWEKLETGVGAFPWVSVSFHGLLERFLGIHGFWVADGLVTIAYYSLMTLVLRAFGLGLGWEIGLAGLLTTGVIGGVLAEVSDVIFNHLSQIPSAAFNRLLLVLLIGLGCILSYVTVRFTALGSRRNQWFRLAIAAMALTFPVLFSSVVIPFWGGRIPRPFVTELFWLFQLGSLAALFVQRERYVGHWRIWAGLGISFSLLLQGDFHSAVVLAIANSTVMICLCWQLRQQSGQQRACIQGIGVSFLAAMVTSIPFWIQRSLANPDATTRLGVFPVDRGHLLFLPSELPYYLLVGLLLWGWFLGLAGDRSAQSRRGLGLIAILSVAACFALPISTVILGQTVQIYQFFDRFLRVMGFGLVIYGSYGLRQLFQRVQPEGLPQRWRAIGLATGLALALLFPFREAQALVSNGQHVRADFPEWQALPDYRHNFNALVAELAKPEYHSAKVLGTLDVQVYAWWVTFQNGASYLPEAPLTTVSDREIEARLLSFCKLLNLSPQAFVGLINRSYTNLFWLGHGKYQASRAYTYAPLSDYFPAVQQQIGRTGLLNSLSVALPISEQRRLLETYWQTPGPTGSNSKLESSKLENSKLDSPRLDIIVLTQDASLQGASPIDPDFELTYENPAFRLWRRKALNSP